MLNRILVISNQYPSNNNINSGIFVYNLVQEFCRAGVVVDVIAPSSWFSFRKRVSGQSYGQDNAYVWRPRYLSFSNKAVMSRISTAQLSLLFYCNSVMKQASKIKRPDVVYSHFLSNGVAALKVAKYFNIPCFVAMGESGTYLYNTEKSYGFGAVKKWLHEFSGIITVSNELSNYCVKKAGVNPRKVIVLPNAVDIETFYPREKKLMRQKHGLPGEKFIISFVGHFDERKGSARVLEALKHYPEIRAIFIGTGSIRPQGEQVLHAGPVEYAKVPELLAASDAFVLPTLSEGSCNAINEALASGLPVISSDIPAIREQVNKDACLFVNPKSVEEISEAIGRLYNDLNLREKMSANSIQQIRNRTLKRRAEAILNWMDKNKE